jgi:hypothetical protein
MLSTTLTLYLNEIRIYPSLPERVASRLSTEGRVCSVFTPTPPTDGPQENGPALKSTNAHLQQKWHKPTVFVWPLRKTQKYQILQAFSTQKECVFSETQQIKPFNANPSIN